MTTEQQTPERDGVRVQPGRIAVVTLDRPERLNALTGRAIAALSRAYADLDADDTVRAIVLTGAGRAFCSGADLSRRGGAFQTPRDPATYRSSPPRPLAFQLRKPVVAAVNGHAVGLGMTLALHCDARIVAREAKWGVVQVRRGVVPDALAHWTLTRSVGTARAAEILLSGRLFTGEDAIRLGVANRVLPATEVLPAAVELAAEMAAGSPLSVALSKRILWSAADGSASLVDDLESEAHRLLMGRPDALEGGQAAFEGRDPEWTASVDDWPTDGPFAGPPMG
ncbi:enoyl-CoA hydratase/isomerase family protein [Pseudonocardia sp. NPDC049154]|uniref:enoyl-CoA hydratase/isomerase family protein n=1 Tax=Pseudonocardia sp. NPDC049154 TaxID=3155501 RepID=UPI0033E604CB